MNRMIAIVVVAASALTLAGFPGIAAVAAPASSIQVDDLTVEHLTSPLGVDQAHPLLGWKLESDTAGAAQSAYEVEVSTDAGFSDDVWESGKVSSGSSADVEYAGDPLQSQTEYHWRVRVWDAGGDATGWSAPTTFETAFLQQADFDGDWIGSPNRMPTSSLAGSNWIWYPEGNPASSAPSGSRYLRKDFTLPSGTTVTSAQVQMTADDYFSLYVNGVLAVASPTSGEAWRTIRVTDISSYLHEGANTLAVVAQNAGAGAAGVVGRLQVQTAAGDTINITTDTSWVAANTLQTGWETPEFDDSAWPAAKIGVAYGSGPWGSAPSAPVPPEPLLRRDFEVDKEVASARVYVAGLGYYKLYLNGSKVGNHELDPGFTQYDHTVLYATYDVTDAVRNGDNVVGVSLGRGYFGQLQPDEWVSSAWHDDPKVKLELQITYTDGTTKRVVSDTDWSAADGPTTSDSVWLGESYDARQDKSGWDAPGFDASAWHPAVLTKDPGGQLRSQLFPAIQVTDDLPVVATTHPSATASVYDFGVPTAGWAKVGLEGPAGSQVTMKYGEKLRDDGTVNNDDVFYTVQNYTYTLKGGGEEFFQPSFSYAGFQYLQVTAPAGVTVTSVTGERVHSDVQRVGDFSSSSDLLDRYNDAQADTILNNLASVPTDTPMYEKRPYTADAFLSADSAIDLFDMQNFYESWMRTHRDDQSPDGTFGNTVPGTVGSKATTDPVWSSSYVAITWDLYQYYGNTRVLADNYAGLKKWMDHYEANIAGTGGIYTGFSYADWLSPEGANAPEGTRLTATAYLYRGATQMAEIASALGHPADAEHYQQLATTIRGDFNDAFYDASAGAYFDNKAAGYRQTSNLLALSFGLVPAQQKATVLGNLVDDIENRGNHLDTGAIGTKELLPVLTENGYADLAYQVATNPTYPGWGYWFDALDATTMWEEWNASSRSHDHDFLGTVVDWEYQDVAGIRPEEPGYRKVRIQPYRITGLDHAQAQVQSPFGDITSSWTKDAGTYTLDVTIPVGSSADVYVPVGAHDVVTTSPTLPEGSSAPEVDGFQKFTVGSGRYRFVAAPGLAATAQPVVSGNLLVGDTLTTTDGDWTLGGATFAYQWMRGDVAIDGATEPTYQLTSDDYGAHISAVVTASVEGHEDATSASEPVGPVSEDGAPTAAVGVDPEPNTSGWQDAAATVTVTGSDEISGIARLEYRVDDGAWADYTAPFVLGAGVTTVDARATDEAGNVSDVVSRVVQVDLDPPVSAATVDEEARTVTLRASDAASGVDHVEYDLGDGWTTYGEPIVVDAGETQIAYRAIDVAGNVESTNSAVVPRVGVDLAPTVVTGSVDVRTRPYGARRTITVRVAGLGGHPTGTVSLRNGSVEVGSAALDATGRATISLSGTALRAGTHHLTILYSGDDTFASSTDSVAVTVSKVRSTIRATMSRASYPRSQKPTLAVKVKPVAYVDGTVTVRLGRRVLKAGVRLVRGAATIRLRAAPRAEGPHRLTVVYSGGANSTRATTHVTYRIR